MLLRDTAKATGRGKGEEEGEGGWQVGSNPAAVTNHNLELGCILLFSEPQFLSQTFSKRIFAESKIQ